MQKIPQQISSYTENANSPRLDINDENKKNSIGVSSSQNSPVSLSASMSGRSKRKCVLNQNKRTFLVDIESDEDYLDSPLPPKKEHVAGRGRGRPPLHREEVKYVFTSRLANFATELVNERVFASLASFHQNCHFPNGIITHEAVKLSCDNANKFRNHARLQPHQNVNIQRDQNIYKNISMPQEQLALQGWPHPMGQPININIPEHNDFQQSITDLNSPDMRRFPPNAHYLSYGEAGVYPTLPNEYYVPYIQPHFNNVVQSGNSQFSMPPLKSVKDENAYSYNQVVTNQNVHLQ